MRYTELIKIVLLLFLTGCMDQCTPKMDIPGPYYLEKNETGSWSLYYDIGEDGIGRAENVHEIGWTTRFIFIKKNNSYYFIDKEKDNACYNAGDIISEPYDSLSYLKLIDSMKIELPQLKKL